MEESDVAPCDRKEEERKGDSEEDDKIEIDGGDKSIPPSPEHRTAEPENNSGKEEKKSETKGHGEDTRSNQIPGEQNPCTLPCAGLHSRVRASPYEDQSVNIPPPVLFRKGVSDQESPTPAAGRPSSDTDGRHFRPNETSPSTAGRTHGVKKEQSGRKFTAQVTHQQKIMTSPLSPPGNPGQRKHRIAQLKSK